MNNNEQRFTRLLEKYRNNTLSHQEYQEFLKLAGIPGAPDTIDKMSEEDWKESKTILRRAGIRADQPQKRRLPVARLLWGSAAAAAILIAAFLFWPQNRLTEPLTYQTGYGETRTILLPDSSSVLLNANSRLVWDSGWKKKGKRDLTLDGEAFFDVKKVNGMEFVVQSDHIKVKVLGTTFNFRSRRGLSHVFLESGKVDLEIPELQEQSVALTPGNAVLYDSEKKDLRIETSSSLNQSASWVEGMLEFENTSLGNILDHLEGLYGKKFKAEDKAILERRMDLSLPYSNWDLIRKVLEISLDVKFTESQDTIVVH